MRNRRMLASVLACVIFLLGVSSQGFAAAKGPMDFVNAAKAKITEVSAAQAKADLDAGKKFILLDVRSKEEFDAGHLPNAVHVSRGLLEFKIGRVIPDKNANIILYCRTGARSAMARARRMHSACLVGLGRTMSVASEFIAYPTTSP